MAAQDAELKLKVSLDLAFFRQQLAGLGQAAAGYNMPINVKLDRSAIAKELRNLERAIGKKKINVELNLLGGLTKDQLEKIQGRLEALSKTKKVEIPVSVKNGATGRDIQDAITGIRQRIAAHQQIRQGSGKLRIPTSIKPSITNADVSEFKKAVQQKLSGISVKVKAEVERGFAAGPTGAAGLFEYMRSQGLSGGNVPQATEVGRSERLKKALNDLTVKQLQALAKEQGVGGVSRMRKDPLIEKLVAELNQDIAENILGNIKNQLRDVGKGPLKSVLDTFARGLFNMLGMDAASMRQQMAERRALPPVDFPATVPPRQRIAIGPSDTGRALPPGATPGALPGTAFAAQRYLPSALGEEMKRVLREAANAFLDTIRTGIRQVSVRDMGPSISRQPLLGAGRIAGFLPGRPSQASMLELNNILAGAVRTYLQAVAREIAQAPKVPISRQPLLGAGSQVAGLLPAAGGTTPIGQMRFNAVRTGATLGQQQFMRAPSIPAPIGGGGGGIVPPSGGGRGGAGGMGSFGRALSGVNLPGAGVIRELGSEFAFATKQVLLFGQAYKMLAFIQNFPAQVGAAVSQLQNFRNTLGAISPTAEEAAASNQLILDLVERYNVPLQSARDGFTKLYASMAPAGFSGDEIRDLFTGITQAAATFGMSADKVDRVNYAFAQMASKGQVMSEELKGQLGDVLPGAMALFAEAAGFEGPKAIQDFSAALEDGAYKGEAMVALLKNVGIVMKQEFGPGAEGAARTFQGVINRMQNSMVLLYESFEPVAINFLNGVVVPLTSGIKEISDGFNAFFTGATAQTAGGGIFAQQLQQLKPAFDGIRQNLNDLLPLFNTLGQVLSSLGKAFIQLAGNPFVGYLLRTYAAVLPLVSIIKILNLQAIIPMIASIIRAIPAFVAFNAAKLRLITTNKSLQLAMQLTGTTAAVTAGRIRLMGAALASLVAPAVLLGIGALIERFMMLKGAVDGVRQSTQQMVASISSMANTGAVKDLKNIYMTTQQQIRTFERLRPFVEGGAIGPEKKLTPGAAAKMEEVGLGSFVSKDILGKPYVSDFVNASKIIEERLKGLRKQADAVREKFPLAQRVAVDLAKQAQNAQQIAPIPATAAEEKSAAKEKAKKERESQVPLLELELATTQQMFELEKQIMAARLGENELEVVRLNGLKEQLRFNEQIAKVKLDNELPAAEKALQIQRLTKEAELARLQTNFDLETKILEAYKKINDTIVDIGKQSALELEDRKEYQRLVMDGILPSTAKITVEVNRQFALEAEKLELLQAQIKDQIAILEAKQNITKEDQAQLDILRQRLKETGANIQELPGLAGETIQSRIQTEGPADPNVSMRENIASLEQEFKRLYSWQNQAVEGSKAIGAALGEAITTGVTGMITGTATAKEVFASFLQSVGQALSQAASQMIATYIAIGIAKMFAGLGGGGNSGGSGGGISNILPGARQYMGGADVAGNFTPNLMGFANGGIVSGGFKAFANGGVVSGPTLGLVGEGRYNEAVVPLPDGRSIPVQLGGRSARDMMGSNAPGMPQAPSLSMKFETTKINGVEYVSREQLEQAMAETRRASIAGGAQRGMSMTLDKIKQSPSTRSSIGIR